MKNFLRILYIIIFMFAAIFVCFHPAKTETNLLRAVFTDNSADETLVKLSGRYSSRVNVLVESDSPEKSSEIAAEFLSKVDENDFSFEDFDSDTILELYKKYYKNLLSQKTAQNLHNGNYDETAAEALDRLYDPFAMMILPLNKDPYLLFEDFVKSLGNAGMDTGIFNDKYYNILSFEVNRDAALSPKLLNKNIKKLVRLQSKLSKDNTKIYLTGTPIHSYYASSKSIIEINIICILSLLFIVGLCRFYFRNVKLLVPIAASLLWGSLCGYLLTSLIFPSIHILTFVFSTTLIGICIDYSLHYFIEKDLSKIMKSLTVSMLTTVCAFLLLIFSGVEILKQISVFTVAGLVNVYLLIVLFYPMLKFDCSPREVNFSLNKNLKKILALVIISVSVCGLFFVKFNDDIKDMYVPSKRLLEAEKLYTDVTGGVKKITFAVVEGENIEDVIRKEENLAQKLEGVNYQALSKFIPSIETQKENFLLRQKLYQNSLRNYGSFLSGDDIETLLAEDVPEEFLTFNKNSAFADFMIDENTSVIVLYDFDSPEIITENGAKYVDVRKDISDGMSSCRKNCMKMILPVFVVLFLFLSIMYKWRTALKIIAPSAVAAIFSIAVAAIFGQDINLFHILAIFLIIGFGLDYSIFRAGGLKHSCDAVLLSCMTSVFSFMLLAFTGFKLISSIGFVLAFGLSVSYLMSLMFDYCSGEDQ